MELRQVVIHGHPVGFRTAGDGPVVVLVHGMAGSSATWRHVVPALARRFTVVAPDLLGHGGSAKPRGDYSVGAQANVLRDLLAALGHERATLVGQSFGGGVAMQFAYQFPEHCERLVLVSSGGLGREVSLLLRGLSVPGAEHVLPLVCSPTLRSAAERMAGWLGRLGLRPAPVAEEMWRGYASLAEREARLAFFSTLRSVIDAGGQTVAATDRLYLAEYMPTLIVWGARDTLIPVRHAHAAAEAIRGSRLVVFPDVGHFPHCEVPDHFVDTVVDFITSTEPARLSEQERRELVRRHVAPAIPSRPDDWALARAEPRPDR
ncbi:MAG TPA: alpha/beta fold hydrolase [Candidatus Binatia bacterium]|jgi:pimeloyl-ACP methyl ester carboxylesterase|nr:alpha/beta fold hydrolase [Candidatus Binatia bacterium]